MNYNYLLYFSVLAETEHYTTAAARLGISQPALSSAIRHLENALGGVKLFEKAGRNIRLTEEGRFYRDVVDDSIKRLHSASIALRDSKTLAPVVIRMGVVSGTLDGFLASEIVKYTRENKRIRIHLTESSSENLMDLVRQEKLDLAIVDATDRDRSLHFRKLMERDYFIALPSAHPMADRSCLDPRDLVHEPQVVFNYNVGKSFKEWTTLCPPMRPSSARWTPPMPRWIWFPPASASPLFPMSALSPTPVCGMFPLKTGTRACICASSTTNGWSPPSGISSNWW